jgi:hypothetical protein
MRVIRPVLTLKHQQEAAVSTRQFTRWSCAGGLAVALALASALVFARQDATASYTGCLNVKGGTIVSVALGDAPLAPCGANQIQVHLGGGDITSITAGTGLQGGTTNGVATLSVQPSYRLPQTCSFGALAKWTGSAWECGADSDTAAVAFAGYDIEGDTGMPNTLTTLRSLALPAGKYAIFAKIQIRFFEVPAEAQDAECVLRAGSDVDTGQIFRGEGDHATFDVMSLMLVHEFDNDGFAEVACADFGYDDPNDYADAVWRNLRITAIKLDSFENVLLTQ